LTVLLILTFFTWIAAAPDGKTVYWQNAWWLMAGSFDSDVTGDKVLLAGNELKGHFSFSMFLFLILLVPAALIGLGDLIQQHVNVPVPDIINKIWPKRLPILAVTSLVLFLLLALQMLGKTGLEVSVATLAEERNPPPADATTESAETKLLRDFRRAEAVSRLGVRRTNWMCLAILATLVAAGGFSLELLLERRGKKPDPRVEFYW